MKRLLLILALPFLMAQTVRDVTIRDLTLGQASGASNEVVAANGVTVTAGAGYWACNGYGDIITNEAACLAMIDDTVDSWQGTYSDDHIFNNENVVTLTEESKVNFATPTSSPTATASAQTIRLVFNKTNASGAVSAADGDPTIDVYVWDGNSLELIENDYTCTGTDHEVQSTWTYEGGSDGSEVYVELMDAGNGSTGTNRKRCGLEYIDWYAEVQ